MLVILNVFLDALAINALEGDECVARQIDVAGEGNTIADALAGGGVVVNCGVGIEFVYRTVTERTIDSGQLKMAEWFCENQSGRKIWH